MNSSEFKLIINLMEEMGNNVCQHLVFTSLYWNINSKRNSKHVMQCTIVNVDGLTVGNNFLVSLSDAVSLTHKVGSSTKYQS